VKYKQLHYIHMFLTINFMYMLDCILFDTE